ncbi:MAG: hypothetical protein K8R11_12115 [Methanococcoides sp.]|nr:hypothetical protein [Methanococcoides sp.]
MTNINESKLINNFSSDSEVEGHLPKSHQLMLRIDKEAEAKVTEILESIKKGETTLEEVKRQRGIL